MTNLDGSPNSLDVGLDAVRRLVRASGLLGVNISVCADGRVSIEALKDSARTKRGEADLHPEGSVLPLPSDMVARLVHEVESKWPK
jgi:hypothetical protein